MWVVSSCSICLISLLAFPSPCGVWVVSRGGGVMTVYIAGFRPLAGCGLFLKTYMVAIQGQVSVPLRGVGCFPALMESGSSWRRNFRPLAGCGLFLPALPRDTPRQYFRPLAGCGLFLIWLMAWMKMAAFPSPCGVWVVSRFDELKRGTPQFPSPCGVWVVSAKLHILSGATGKRIVNSAVLLYHIGRCLSIAN